MQTTIDPWVSSHTIKKCPDIHWFFRRQPSCLADDGERWLIMEKRYSSAMRIDAALLLTYSDTVVKRGHIFYWLGCVLSSSEGWTRTIHAVIEGIDNTWCEVYPFRHQVRELQFHVHIILWKVVVVASITFIVLRLVLMYILILRLLQNQRFCRRKTTVSAWASCHGERTVQALIWAKKGLREISTFELVPIPKQGQKIYWCFSIAYHLSYIIRYDQ